VNGPRNCIGHGFALMEGQIVLAMLAQRVTFSLAPGRRIAREALITLRPRDGIRLRVERRLPWTSKGSQMSTGILRR
jgi:cytochrome P450